MQLKGNEMTVTRGETFTIDRTIVNRDGSPFVISSEWNNPYILITVSSSSYNQENRYVLNVWLSLKDVHTFHNTTILEAKSGNVEYILNGESIHLSEISSDVLYSYDGKYIYLSEVVDGNKILEEYSLRIIYPFTHEITKDWVEQSYLYSIRLVAGTSIEQYVDAVYTGISGVVHDNLTHEEKIQYILNMDATKLEGINLERPLVSFDTAIDILPSTKLSVLSDLNGGWNE
uniref:hypothetical protein n=1 Tax=Alloprevotella sp. TaxID=1872471 RepID=UPI0040257F90